MNIKLPQPVETYFNASNIPDPSAFLSIFDENAIVVDEGHEYQGATAIKEWSEQHHFSTKLIMEATNVVQIHNKTIITAKIDGDFDKTGLPDPLLLDFHFTVSEDKITRLIILFARKLASDQENGNTISHDNSEVMNIDFITATERAMHVRRLYHQIEEHINGKVWTIQEDMLGFVTDVGIVGRLVIAADGPWAYGGDVHVELEIKLSECLWWILVLSNRLGVDITEAFKSFVDKRDTELTS